MTDAALTEELDQYANRNHVCPAERIWLCPLDNGPQGHAKCHGPCSRAELVAQLAWEMAFEDYAPQGLLSITGRVTGRATGPDVAYWLS
jgi:hypothetical protein